MSPVQLVHFSDILCVWAYAGQTILDKIVANVGNDVSIEFHFCSVFADTEAKITEQWKGRGGFQGYGKHVRDVANQFETLPIHQDTWTTTRPSSSASPHMFIKAIELVDAEQGNEPSNSSDRLPVLATKEVRKAFFEHAKDVSNWCVQREISKDIGINFDDIVSKIESGEAYAKLASDYQLSQIMNIEGSPTYVLNEGRQKLFGNVSYEIILASVEELLTSSHSESASLC